VWYWYLFDNEIVEFILYFKNRPPYIYIWSKSYQVLSIPLQLLLRFNRLGSFIFLEKQTQLQISQRKTICEGILNSYLGFNLPYPFFLLLRTEIFFGFFFQPPTCWLRKNTTLISELVIIMECAQTSWCIYLTPRTQMLLRV